MRKKIAKEILSWVFLGVAGLTSPAWSGEIYIESADGNYKLTPSVVLQLQQKTVNSNQSKDTSGFLLRRGRIKIEGNLVTSDFEYEVEFDIGTPDAGDSQFDLKDFYFDYRTAEFLRVKAGQFKTPFGLQELTSSKKQQFADRSLASEEFVHGRDIGVMLKVQQGKSFEYNVGIFNGEGDNNKTDDAENLYSARMVFLPFGEYKEEESDLKGTAVYRMITGIEAFYTKEAVTGDHLLVWGGFGGFKLSGFSLRVEYFDRMNQDDSSADNENSDARGYYAQTGYLLFPRKLEMAIRQSQLFRSGPDNNEKEYAVVLNYFFNGHHAKLQFDYTLQLFEGTREKKDHLIRTQFQFYF